MKQTITETETKEKRFIVRLAQALAKSRQQSSGDKKYDQRKGIKKL
jgi:hypothetical protein